MTRGAVDASPLIFLARVDRLELLRLSSAEIVVPEPVAKEIFHRGPTDPAAAAIEAHRWLLVEPSPPVPQTIAAWDLGAGESSVLAWCQSHPPAEAIIDDLAGRRCAQGLGLPVRGTLGLVLTAKQRGLIEQARPLLEELRHSGMYLSSRVLDRALERVGE